MAEVKWTEDQLKVINLRNRNILVSAAAGSGKTAVLVERIITMITESDHPIDIDHLLIVTFTNAAAAEMKERIGVAIEKKLIEMPDNLHLQKQMTLIHSAQITTIHSFCLNVIRNHFHQINLDPSFRIGDEAELKLLKSDVVEEILEKHYEEADDDFIAFIESYSSGKSDAAIEDMILQLYHFSMSYPWPIDWLIEKKKSFSITSLEEMGESEWMQSLLSYVKEILVDLRNKNREAITICNEIDGPLPYLDAIENDRDLIESLLKAKTYEEYEIIFHTIAFARLSSKRAPEVSVEKKETVKAIRDEIKKSINDLNKHYFFQPKEEMLNDIKNVKKVMNVLIDLTIEFEEEFAHVKAEKNIIDFNDLEHFALQILVDKETGAGIKPSNVAVELSDFYEEILIDEYQDSNFVQETILTSISKEKFGNPNLFMVGDVKQSIYKFRLARPELFMDKFNNYTIEDGQYQRIDLHKNFRSRSVVLDTANFIFQQIMSKKLGNIEYDADAALYYGANYEETIERIATTSEVLIVEDFDGIENSENRDNHENIIDDNGQVVSDSKKSKEVKQSLDEELLGEDTEDYTSKELEARIIAAKIKELVDPELGMMVWEKGYRKATYKDIVILLRTMSNWSDVFVDTLMTEGIPAYSDTQTGYFSALEVKTILNVLKIIDNPRQDIPFVAVLHSPIVSLSSNELALIRANGRQLDMYDAVLEYSLNGKELELRDKLLRFLEQLTMYRGMVPFIPVHELIQKVIDESGYLDYVKAMPAGKTRAANITMLIEKAIQYEATSYVGLFHFIRYIEKLKKYDIDYGEAGTISENDNTVRIMSIHKSKGLEFPIVFVAGMGKKFNNQDSRSKVVIHPDLGLGPDYIDYTLRTKSPTLIKKVMQMKLSLENIAEELRVLYVALTRAKEKLILTGYVKNLEETIKKNKDILSEDEIQIPFQKLSEATCYFDFVIPALIRHPAFSEILYHYGITPNPMNKIEKENKSIVIKKTSILDLTSNELVNQIDLEKKKEKLLSFDTSIMYDETTKRKIEEHFSYQYPFQNEVSIHSKVTVSELKKLGQTIDEEYSEALYRSEDVNHITESDEIKPKFISKEQAKSKASRGTLYHKVLECMDLLKVFTLDDITKELNRLVNLGVISDTDMELIDKHQIEKLMNSNLVNRMRIAKSMNNLYTEKQFVLGIPAKDINLSLQSEEIVLVQGIIDVYFEEEGELVLVDYKTDHIRAGEEEKLVKRYNVQLNYYEKALEQISGKKVKEKIIYSLTLGKEISI